MGEALKIRDRFLSDRPLFSFEFFPPKTPKGAETLWRTIGELRELNPAYVSVTYGAGGSTREKTKEIVCRIQREYGLAVMAHLTCVGATKDELRRVLDDYAAAGICNILALRGDPPEGAEKFTPVPGGCRYASELIELIRKHGAEHWCIGAAAFPEKHPESESVERDLEVLKIKCGAGADFFVTQLFFDNDRYCRYVERARAAGVDRRIIPGLMPLTAYAQLDRFAELCGASVPEGLRRSLEAVKEDAEQVREIGLAYAAAQCADLLRRGVPGLHFYTLNRSRASRVVHACLKALRHWY